MASQEPGKPGHNSTIAIVALIVLAGYADQAWLTVFLGVIVIYGLVVDWLSRK